MLRIIGDDVYRDGSKIGWVSSNDVYGASGRKLGYWESNDIYDRRGRKLGYIDGNYIVASGRGKISLSSNRRQVSGGSISDIERAAIRLLIGD